MYTIQKMQNRIAAVKFDFKKMPFETMEVGEFFFIAAEPIDRARLTAGCAYRGNRLGKKFSVKQSLCGFDVCRVA